MSNKAGAEHRATAESMFRAIDTSGSGCISDKELVISLFSIVIMPGITPCIPADERDAGAGHGARTPHHCSLTLALPAPLSVLSLDRPWAHLPLPAPSKRDPL